MTTEIEFKNEWKYACPRCGQVQTDIARMKRHYARMKPCMGVYNTETRKYSGEPILDIPWEILQKGVGVKSRKSKVAEKKAEKERIANMTWENCPMVIPEIMETECIVESLCLIFKATYLDTKYVIECNPFSDPFTFSRFNKLVRKKRDKAIKEDDKFDIFYNYPLEKNYMLWITKRLKEKIHFHMNIKPNINNEELDHVPFFIKYNYILDLFPLPFKKHNFRNYPREGVVFSRRTLYIHNRITGEVIGHYAYEPEDWDTDLRLRDRDWGGCPNLGGEEFLHKKIDYS